MLLPLATRLSSLGSGTALGAGGGGMPMANMP
jgi:hypothetical protein